MNLWWMFDYGFVTFLILVIYFLLGSTLGKALVPNTKLEYGMRNKIENIYVLLWPLAVAALPVRFWVFLYRRRDLFSKAIYSMFVGDTGDEE